MVAFSSRHMVSKCFHRVVLVLVVAFCCVPTHGEGVRKYSAHYIINNDDYYELSDLGMAAKQMRSNAQLYGVDVDEVCFPEITVAVENDTLSVFLNSETFKVALDAETYVDCSEGSELHSRDSKDLAVLIIRRSLSVNEVVRLLEDGIRISKRLAAGYVVYGSVCRLAELKQRDYCLWIGPFLPAYKIRTQVAAGEDSRYRVRCFEYADLESVSEEFSEFGVTVTGVYELVKTIHVEAGKIQIGLIARMHCVDGISSIGRYVVDDM